MDLHKQMAISREVDVQHPEFQNKPPIPQAIAHDEQG
jgi:hypothetical protein